MSTADPCTAGVDERPSARFDWAAATETGKVRRHNEDSFITEAGLFVVADGMGGHAAGDVASALAIAACRDVIERIPLQPDQVAALVDDANDRVHRQAATTGLVGMGTTLVGAVVVDNAGDESVVVFNVGDSRCYVFDAHAGLRQLTRDHSVVQELVDAGQLTSDEAALHADRNVVTRAIGIGPSVAADFFVVPSRGSIRLLLCSDGVSGQITEAAIAGILEGADCPGAATESLIAAVLEGPAPDNATAIVVDIAWQPVADDRPAGNDADITGPRPLRPTIGLIDSVPLDGTAPPQPRSIDTEITEVPE